MAQKKVMKTFDKKLEKQWLKEVKTKIKRKDVLSGIDALKAFYSKQLKQAKESKEKKQLFQEEEEVNATVDFDEFPIELDIKRIFYAEIYFKDVLYKYSKNLATKKVPLPHPFVHCNENLKVCLITFNKERMKKLFKENKTKLPYIHKILSIEAIKKIYILPEKRRELSYKYDCFLVEQSAIHMMPRLLGKKFCIGEKKLIPVSIMSRENMQKMKKEDIDFDPVFRYCLQSTTFGYKGLTTRVKIGRVGQSEKELYENFIKVVSHVVNRTNNTWENIFSVRLKLGESPTLPVYASELKVPDQSDEESEQEQED
eukprot:snap_masked-scaffold_4-processed-gene-12.14-mRNA-1 protein AED:1.00 eAED:1.00 QI:0/-1/0/0/-1/1/1/0/312